MGASGGVFAILIAFGIVFGENEILLIPFPFSLKAKYFVAILIVVTLAFADPGRRQRGLRRSPGRPVLRIHLREVCSPGPASHGWGYQSAIFGLRNQYYRWKRRRAARKFEVYMRKHNRTVEFDEQGNYIPPEEEKKNGGSKSGWVN